MAGAKFLRGDERYQYQNWETIPRYLKAEATRWVYLGPNGAWFDLEGRDAGKQGVRMARELQGAFHLPFEHLLTEGAYQVGATYERSNIKKRVIKFGVILGGKDRAGRPFKSDAYRRIEENWWQAWPHDQAGWLGCHTRFGGWRWAQVQLSTPTNTSMKIDPTAMQNNMMQWDMEIMAVKPWFAKRMLVETFTAHAETVAAHGFDEETITIANRGTMPVNPLFIYSPGKAAVQDGMTDNIVELPTTTADDGNVLVDTDPANRMLTADKDPVDNFFYERIRASRLLDFFLHDLGALGVPVWRRANGIRFTSQIPPKTVANLKVRHYKAGGTVTVLMPQRFTRPA